MIGDKPTRNLPWTDAAGKLTIYALQFLSKIAGLSEEDFVAALGGVFVPKKAAIIWCGTIAEIPEHYQLCDGTNDTPDLTGLFVVHADADSGGTYNVGDTGGADSVTLTEAQMPSHRHNVSVFQSNNTSTGGSATRNRAVGNGNNGDASGTTSLAGGDEAHENRPPYYALAYIMRVS